MRKRFNTRGEKQGNQHRRVVVTTCRTNLIADRSIESLAQRMPSASCGRTDEAPRAAATATRAAVPLPNLRRTTHSVTTPGQGVRRSRGTAEIVRRSVCPRIGEAGLLRTRAHDAALHVGVFTRGSPPRTAWQISCRGMAAMACHSWTLGFQAERGPPSHRQQKRMAASNQISPRRKADS